MEATFQSDLLDTTIYQTKYRSWWLAITDQNTLHSHCLSTFFKSVASNSVIEFSENQKLCSSYFSISFIFCKLSLNWTCWQVTVEISGYLCLDFEGSHSSVNIKGEKLQEELKFKNCIVYCDLFITSFYNSYRTN